MKALKTKVMLSAFVLLFALVATIGSTFAWFTTSSQVAVDSFQLEVQTVDSLLIRVWNGESLATEGNTLLDAQTYSTNLTEDMINDVAMYSTFPGYKLTPVTAAQQTGTYPSLTYTTLNPFALSILDIGSNTRAALGSPVANNDTTGNYIELKFWLMSQGLGTKEVVLQNLNINVNDITQLAAREIVRSAVRLGVGSTSGATAGDLNPTSGFVFSRRVVTDPQTLPYGFEFTPGMKGYHTPADPQDPNDVFNQISSEDQGTLYGLHKSFYVSSGAVSGESTSAWNDANLQTIVSLTQNTPQLVTVRIYIEGWDETANNAIIAAKFNISFQFAFRQAV